MKLINKTIKKDQSHASETLFSLEGMMREVDELKEEVAQVVEDDSSKFSKHYDEEVARLKRWKDSALDSVESTKKIKLVELESSYKKTKKKSKRVQRWTNIPTISLSRHMKPSSRVATMQLFWSLRLMMKKSVMDL